MLGPDYHTPSGSQQRNERGALAAPGGADFTPLAFDLPSNLDPSPTENTPSDPARGGRGSSPSSSSVLLTPSSNLLNELEQAIDANNNASTSSLSPSSFAASSSYGGAGFFGRNNNVSYDSQRGDGSLYVDDLLGTSAYDNSLLAFDSDERRSTRPTGSNNNINNQHVDVDDDYDDADDYDGEISVVQIDPMHGMPGRKLQFGEHPQSQTQTQTHPQAQSQSQPQQQRQQPPALPRPVVGGNPYGGQQQNQFNVYQEKQVVKQQQSQPVNCVASNKLDPVATIASDQFRSNFGENARLQQQQNIAQQPRQALYLPQVNPTGSNPVPPQKPLPKPVPQLQTATTHEPTKTLTATPAVPSLSNPAKPQFVDTLKTAAPQHLSEAHKPLVQLPQAHQPVPPLRQASDKPAGTQTQQQPTSQVFPRASIPLQLQTQQNTNAPTQNFPVQNTGKEQNSIPRQAPNPPVSVSVPTQPRAEAIPPTQSNTTTVTQDSKSSTLPQSSVPFQKPTQVAPQNSNTLTQKPQQLPTQTSMQAQPPVPPPKEVPPPPPKEVPPPPPKELPPLPPKQIPPPPKEVPPAPPKESTSNSALPNSNKSIEPTTNKPTFPPSSQSSQSELLNGKPGAISRTGLLNPSNTLPVVAQSEKQNFPTTTCTTSTTTTSTALTNPQLPATPIKSRPLNPSTPATHSKHMLRPGQTPRKTPCHSSLAHALAAVPTCSVSTLSSASGIPPRNQQAGIKMEDLLADLFTFRINIQQVESHLQNTRRHIDNFLALEPEVANLNATIVGYTQALEEGLKRFMLVSSGQKPPAIRQKEVEDLDNLLQNKPGGNFESSRQAALDALKLTSNKWSSFVTVTDTDVSKCFTACRHRLLATPGPDLSHTKGIEEAVTQQVQNFYQQYGRPQTEETKKQAQQRSYDRVLNIALVVVILALVGLAPILLYLDI
ncbi:hypothetical protein Pelo_6307 [Pelomyxa schiedti]|nr:hypothetical protein Pelo_6307 [Pelomyxa schiedti]